MERILRKVVAGGQTGVDQAALAAATHVGLSTGGWMHRDRIDENGEIPHWKQWHLEPLTDEVWEEHRATFESLRSEGLRYDEGDLNARRTMLNALHSCGTLTILLHHVADGTNLGLDVVLALGKPTLILDLKDEASDKRTFASWLQEHHIEVLNLNGPRESSSPGINERCTNLFKDWFGDIASCS
eukprot:TRINITY_DN57836_c0_g1_i1.p1 TRINITY_DN57836_c0_g1~~TRINITY_DN57836_c0_g1_i1.p1  ORF type:complete len:185 (+),score=20.04 TRINITY_DN57836_c0_g1_i1:40-594(+)